MAEAGFVEVRVELLGDFDGRVLDAQREGISVGGGFLVAFGFILLGHATMLTGFLGEGFKVFLCHVSESIRLWLASQPEKTTIFWLSFSAR